MKSLRLLLACVCVLLFAVVSWCEEPKLQAADVVARHLDSIGTAAARAAAKSRTLRASAHMAVLIGGTGSNDGSAMMVSDARRFSIAMKVPDTSYPGEQFVFDGAKAQIGLIAPSKRSLIGEFMYRQDQILRDGLVGGTLLTSWALIDINGRKPTLKYEGLKKIDGRELHDLSYFPKKADRDLLIHLYFEPDTFRHVKTSYEFSIAPTFGHNQLQHGSYTRYRIEETFSDFKVVDGLTLPSKWNLRYTAVADSTYSLEWQISVDAVAHNNLVD
jgi:hypothetical protein